VLRSVQLAAMTQPAQNYNLPVARGWESKSVEAQQAESSEKPAKRRDPMSAEEAARWREKESLRCRAKECFSNWK